MSSVRRLFKGHKDRKAEEGRKSSPESETKRPEGFFQKSIFRSLSAFFGRNLDDDDLTPRSAARSVKSLSDPDATGTSRRSRHSWRAPGGTQSAETDFDKKGTDVESSDGSMSVVGSRGCVSDDDFTIKRSGSALLLPSPRASTGGYGNSSVSRSSYPRRVSSDTPSSDTRFSPTSSDEERPHKSAENDLRIQYLLGEQGNASGTTLSDADSNFAAIGGAPRPFNIKHGSVIDNDGPTVPYESQLEWMEDEKDNERTSRWRINDRRFFNIKSSISSLRRSLSTPKARNHKMHDSDHESGRIRSVMARYMSHSDKEYESSGSLSDSDRSPGRFRIALGLEHHSLSAILSTESFTARSNIISARKDGELISARKERVVVLTAGAPTDVVTLTPAQWDGQAVSKIEQTFSSLPLLKDVPLPARPELFQKKLIACQTVVDFGAKKVMQRAIELKRQTLLEIIEYISTTRNCMNEHILQDVIDMVEANVFRSLPPREKKNIMFYDIDEDEPTLEKAWPHLQIVYDVFLRVIVSSEVTSKMAKNVIDKSFVLKLLNVLSSEDQRERDYLKTILHRIYGKIMPLRTFIRKAMDNVFTNFIYETENPYGITELLEILGSIINGFAVPLKEEHKIYLEKSLTPLHKPKTVRSYHAALSYCMIQYINKDCSLAGVILRSILKFWPTTSAQTEILFLNELEEVLSLTESAELDGLVKSVARRLSQCVASSHFQVAERALYIWNNNRVVRQLNVNKDVVYRYIVPAVKANIDGHWNQNVRALTYNVSKIMSEHDPELYNSCESISGSSRKFPPATITPHNSWEVVTPADAEKSEHASARVSHRDGIE
ncbi:protein phosphatase 2A [Babesia gibsoni]|uniref:Protein phosphatase 2A n=1 Tax=Babesia gibsoni TaxID=33632 RepID=A0AAD8UUP1_BABGI|nr:protein phosphatase 2A [Babesia gibsoni]